MKNIPWKRSALQIILGLAAGTLETVTAHFCQPLLPLYMDCIWNTAVSFYSLLSGLICGLFFQVAVVALGFSSWSSLVFTICSITVTLTVRCFVKLYPRFVQPLQKVLGVVALIIAQTLLISIEGGLLYILIFDVNRYGELSSTNSFIYSFFMQGFPYAFSAIIGRIPVNLADKTIAVLVGGSMYTLGRLAARKISDYS